MRDIVWLGASTLTYPQGGGHIWAYLNWALGLRQAGCDVVWLEHVDLSLPHAELAQLLTALREKLRPFGLEYAIAFYSDEAPDAFAEFDAQLVPLASANDAALFLNMAYSKGHSIVNRFARTAMIDIDPGLLQVWLSDSSVRAPRHDCYFTIGENVGGADALFPDAGIDWIHTPPCVSLQHWPMLPPPANGAFTTVSHWSADEWFSFRGEVITNDKRTGFAPFLELPAKVEASMELALCLAADEDFCGIL